MPAPTAVLVDFAGTLLVPEPREQWVAAVCPDLPADEVARLARALERSGRSGGPEPVALPADRAEDYAQRDLSPERHRALYEGLMSDVPGVGDALARQLYDRGTGPEGWCAYPGSRPLLQALRERGVRVAVVSNVGFPLRPVFAGHGLDELVDAYVQSYEIGVVKPAPKIFQAACRALDVAPADCLMVGDNPSADGGACHLGIRVLLLPYTGPRTDHGLDAVLRLL